MSLSRTFTILFLLAFLISLAYRTFFTSLNPRFFRDIDFHCYRQFSEIFLREGGYAVADEALNSDIAAKSLPQFSLYNSTTWRIPPGTSPQHFTGPERPISLISRLLTIFIEKPARFLWQQPFVQENAQIQRIASYVAARIPLTLNYEYFLCDYGPMYYPAAFILIYALFLSITHFSPVQMQKLHALGHYLNGVGAAVLFWEFYSVPVQLFQILCSLASQTIYMSGISAISNDLWSASITILMLICIKYRHYIGASVLFSVGVGFKMNALLYGPALMVVYLVEFRLSIVKVLAHFFLIGIVQLILSAPFMLNNFSSYVQIAYNFTRDFDHIENIKWTFLGDAWRHDALFYKVLLLSTALGMGLFLWYQYWWMNYLRQREKQTSGKERRKTRKLLQKARLFTMLGAHFVAFVFVRGLHIQFSLWVYFALPFLIQCAFLDAAPGVGKTQKKRRKQPSSFTTLLRGAFQFLLITSFMLLFDFCISHPRRVIHTQAFVPMMQALFQRDFGTFISRLTGEDDSLFGKLGTYIPYAELIQDDRRMQQQYYNLVGHFYLEGFDWNAIPCGFILFVLECVVLVYLFRYVKRNYRAAVERVAKHKVE